MLGKNIESTGETGSAFDGVFSHCFIYVFDDLLYLNLMVLEVLRKSRFIDFSSTTSVWPTKKHSVQ